MAKKAAVKRRAVAAPKDLDEAAEFIREIGAAKREIEEEERKLAEKLDKLKAEARERVKPFEEQIEERLEGLYAYAEAHRVELTEGEKKKTVVVPSGEMGWRWTPPAIVIRGWKKVLGKLKELGLDRFIRVKEGPNKEAMLAEVDVATAVRGIAVTQREEFFVKPSDVELEIASDVQKLKKAVG